MGVLIMPFFGSYSLVEKRELLTLLEYLLGMDILGQRGVEILSQYIRIDNGKVIKLLFKYKNNIVRAHQYLSKGLQPNENDEIELEKLFESLKEILGVD
jgi:hypothetical protein